MEFTPEIPLVSLAGFRTPAWVSALLPEQKARSLGVLPLYIESGKLVAACLDPSDRPAILKAASIVRMPVRPVAAPIPELRAAFDRVYPAQTEPFVQPEPAEILYRLGHLTSTSVKQAVLSTQKDDKQVMQAWLESGLIDDEGLLEVQGWLTHLPHLRPSSLNPQAGIAALLPPESARRYKILPLWWVGEILIALVPCCTVSAQADPLQELPGVPVRCIVTTTQVWEQLYRKIYLTGLPSPDPLPDILAALKTSGEISEPSLQAARTVSTNTGETLDTVLIKHGLVSSQAWQDARSAVLALESGSLPARPQRLDCETYLPVTLARKLNLVPLSIRNNRLLVGMLENNREAVLLVEAVTGRQVEPCLVDAVQLERYFKELDAQTPPARPVINPRLADILLAMGLISHSLLTNQILPAQKPGEELSSVCLRLGLIDELDLCEALSIQTGMPLVELNHTYFDDNLIRKIPFGLYTNHILMPVVQRNGDIWIVTADPMDNKGLLAVEEATGQRVWPLIAPRSVIAAALKHTFDQGLRSVPEQIRTIVQYFVRNRYISQVQASTALDDFSASGTPLDQAIVNASGLSEEEVAGGLARYSGLMAVDLNLKEEKTEVIDALGQKQTRTYAHDPVNIDAARLIDQDTAVHLGALPVKRAGGEVGVAFASLPVESSVHILEKMLALKVIPLIASRTALENAIHRTLGRQNLGTRLLVAGLINRRLLNDALELAQKSGVRLGKALINRGYITEQQLYHFLAEQSGLPYSRLDPSSLDITAAQLLTPEMERKLGVLPLSINNGLLTLAVVDPLNEVAIAQVEEITRIKVLPVLATESDFEQALESLYRQNYLNTSVLELLERTPEDSAYSVLSTTQKVLLVITFIISIIWLWFDYTSYLILLNVLSTIFYLSFSLYKFYLIYRAMNRDLEVPVTRADTNALIDRELPIYTILVPVYRESGVLPDLILALSNLDYPATKLDIKVLLEDDDPETLATFNAINPPPQFQAIMVPSAVPKTKPKACNYGLVHARGKYVVIFDAEDLPDRDQLKKVIVAFSRVQPDVVCIQTKLNYYNRNQNLLTRWFTVEYSMWFDLFLPGLDASGAPIPLGGTSNHFKKSALVEAGAWDPFNVTEDADLGVRIFKRGYKTAIVDSTTYEEANSQLYNWIRQRSRWIKGYIQTWLVHMRHPLRLLKEIGPNGFLSFQFVVGGTFFAALMNPIYWALTTLWFLGRWGFVETLYPGVIFFFGSICLYVGNFAFTYMNVAGAMRRGYYDMVKFALLSPLYWGLISIAAWRGFFQLITRPHFWEKTVHGLAPAEQKAETNDQPAAQAAE